MSTKRTMGMIGAAAVVALLLQGAVVGPAGAWAATDDAAAPAATSTPAAVEESAPTATPTPTDTAQPTPTPTDAAQPADPGLGRADNTSITASFDLTRVTLTDGHAVGTASGTLTQVPPIISASGDDLFRVAGTTGTLDATAEYQISTLEAGTNYWITLYLNDNVISPNGECVISSGRADGTPNPVDKSPFTCSASVSRSYYTSRVTFTLDLNRDAEAAGVIQTQGDIALTDGHYEPNVPWHTDGSATVGQNSNTRFDVVLRVGDTPIDEHLAQTVFVYRIEENGIPRPFWVAGYSQNFRGTIKFSPESKCGIYGEDPVKAGVPLADQQTVAVSPYSCEVTSDRFIGYRGVYEATFTVAKRQMTDVTLPLQQAALVVGVCGKTPENCGLNLATVTGTYGKGKIISTPLDNPTGVTAQEAFMTSATQGVSVANGFDITLSIGNNPPLGIGLAYTVTLKQHYEKTVTSSTTTSETVTFPVPPHTRGWVIGAPPLVHTEGDIVVLKDGQYFNVKNVVADFPDKDGKWENALGSSVLPPTVGEGAPAAPGDPGVGATPGGAAGALPVTALVPDAAGSAGARNATTGRLASTGADTQSLPLLIAFAGALLVGGVALLRRGRRRRRRRSAGGG